ncbi:Sip1-related alpha-galactosidase [Flavitalea sp.]|nr:Sip1-related alpha-galactosidase [Flavitalea sp.]
MKKFLVFVLLLAASYSYSQHTEVISASNKLILKWNKKERLSGGIATIINHKDISVKYQLVNDVTLLWMAMPPAPLKANEIAGIFFDEAPQYKQGVALWRYKPWNSWTKPMAIAAASNMPVDDVQFYYWQYEDGVYGAAVPLSGNGFRSTIGSNGSKWGSKSISYADNKNIDSVPSMAIAFGKDPFELFERIYGVSLKFMGKGENLRSLKKFPEQFNYIGWCTWNASDNGKKLNEELLLRAAESFSANKFPLGWMLVDDGWFQAGDRKLQSFTPNLQQFPNGFKPVLDKLKKQYGIKYMGVWHTFNGLWNGIDTASELGKHFASAMFSWKQKESPDKQLEPDKTYHFIRPDSDSLSAFYNTWHSYLKQEGFDFVKVDNQLAVEKMAVDNYPIFSLSDSMHKALYKSADKHFKGAVINCMDMTAEAYLNFGSSAVARTSEDYFPYKKNETYNLQHGNAAAHVLQAIYNSIYFGQMVYPDFDIFQSHNPNAIFHAVARAINCGPIYITDNIGEQKFDVLRPLIYSDGRIIKSETPLLPTDDCLFQVQDAKLFKASSMVRNAGLLGVWNAADANSVEGIIKASDIRNIKGNDFIIYEHFSKSIKKATFNDQFPVKLSRMGYQLYYIVPLKNNFAALGLTDKYNAPATILKEEWKNNNISVTLYEGGTFKAYSKLKPSRILINGKPVREYLFQDNLLTLEIPALHKPVVTIYW